jgi:hypothetical protein
LARPLLATLALVIPLLAGCSGPTRPDADAGAPTNAEPVQFHGVIQLPGENEGGVQFRRSPWFVTDAGEWVELELDDEFLVLADPGSANRGVVLNGESFRPDYVPVGMGEDWLRVTGYRFDEP